MLTSSPAIRSGPIVALAIALAIAVPASARDTSSHHFNIYGSLTPATTSQSSGGAVQVNARASRETPRVLAQTGGTLVLTAKLANAPLGCAGDTIFENGFDP